MLICEVQKNTKERVCVSIEEFKGHRFVDCRVYYENDQGELKPTRKGICLNAETIDEVIKALRKGADILSPNTNGKKGKPGSTSTENNNISEDVRQWVASVSQSQFSVKDCRKGLALTEPKQAHLVNVVFSKLCDEGLIERTRQGRGIYNRRMVEHG